MEKGYTVGPVNYLMQNIYFQKDREGQVVRTRFHLAWERPEHATLFYVAWNNYHWESDSGASVYILKIHNPLMDRIGERAETRAILHDPFHIVCSDFLAFYGRWQQLNSRQSAGVSQRLADA